MRLSEWILLIGILHCTIGCTWGFVGAQEGEGEAAVEGEVEAATGGEGEAETEAEEAPAPEGEGEAETEAEGAPEPEGVGEPESEGEGGSDTKGNWVMELFNEVMVAIKGMSAEEKKRFP